MTFLIFLAECALIFLTSRYVLHELWHRIHRTVKNTSVSFYLLSLIYLPGTFAHELSHFVTSVILFVKPHHMNLLPHAHESDNYYHLRFGFVQHEKTDPFRGSIIGLSPLFAGFLFFYTTFRYELFPAGTLLMNILLVYFFFSIASTMFPSRDDIRDIPIVLLIILAGMTVLFVFNIDIVPYMRSHYVIRAVSTANTFLLPATLVNVNLAWILYMTRKK